MPTIDSWLTGLGRNHQKADVCPIWPPDLFAICGALLKISGSYLKIFERAGIDPQWTGSHLPGERWRAALDRQKSISPSTLAKIVPAQVRAAWGTVMTHRSTALGAMVHSDDISGALIRLTLIADAACVGIGIEPDPTAFLSTAQGILDSHNLRTFCWDVPADFICVLGKQHTPQRGATFRSLTHHLSLYWPNDIDAQWMGPYERDDAPQESSAKTVSLLLLPWPTTVDSADFKVSNSVKSRAAQAQGQGHYFDYHPTRPTSLRVFRRQLQDALLQARLHASRVDAIVFPEAALSLAQYKAAETFIVDEKIMLIAGIRIPARGAGHGANLCALQVAGLLPSSSRRGRRNTRRTREIMIDKFRAVQSKHHRWCLDRQQILQYQLAGRIPPRDSVWENISLPPRQLHFVTIGQWLTWSMLICEDLARQDPAADLIRAVGPNLLITLLMDGPQLRGRWPSRYASVLAEDPGTSVLTLTSLGMADRCRPMLASTGRRADKSRAVALWRDIESGEHEIVLDEGDNACILTLQCKSKEEIAADGRGDGHQAHFPIYTGYKSFKVAA